MNLSEQVVALVHIFGHVCTLKACWHIVYVTTLNSLLRNLFIYIILN